MGKSVTPEPEMQKFKKLEKDKSKLFKVASKKPLEKDLDSQTNGNDHISDSDTEIIEKVSKKVYKHDDISDDKISKKRRKSDKKAKSKAILDTTDSESEGEREVVPAKVAVPDKSNKTALENIPNDIRFEPKNLVIKPKGLVDALSNFFTPGLKRTSRTAMNSLLKPESAQSEEKLDPKSILASSDPDKEEVKKVRLSVEEKDICKKDDNETKEDRKRHASSGQQQVKSLYDGLSHLYSDCDSRLRSVTNQNYSDKQRQTLENDPDNPEG